MSPSKPRLLVVCAILCAGMAAHAFADVTLVENGQARAVIVSNNGVDLSYVVYDAALEFQHHVELMTGVTLPYIPIGYEYYYPGYSFVYIGENAASIDAGIDVSGLEEEFYTIRTVSNNLYIVGKDGGVDDWTQLSTCWPGTMFGVYYVLGDVLGVRWIWPGELGTYAPHADTLVVPELDVTDGPRMEQRKYSTPRVGKCYLTGEATYGFGIPIIPSDMGRRTELANEETLWQRRLELGTRNNPTWGHHYNDWWDRFGATHPEYFAELPAGYSQPYPISSGQKRCKLDVSRPAVNQQIVDNWVAEGTNNSMNVCPNDSAGFCICDNCKAWNLPTILTDTEMFNGSGLQSDLYTRHYSAVATLATAVNSNVRLYGYAYGPYRHAPIEATLPGNVALEYIPGAPSDTMTDLIAETETDILGWVNAGCMHMYLRPNWMLSAHVGPFWPLTRVGNHFSHMVQSGGLKGFYSDSSCSSYACFGPYYYMINRMMADPTLTVTDVKDEYCSAFGSAGPKVAEYLQYWEDFIYAEADAGNQPILGWSSCVAAYDDTYLDSAFDGAETILDEAYALLGPGEDRERERLDLMQVGIDHGRLTARAISLVHPTEPITQHLDAESAMYELLAFRNEYAESWAIWREWFINREAYVTNMQNYWEFVLDTPGYTLTVESGSGDGIYHAGAEVLLSADAPPAGQSFHHWTGDTDGVANVLSADTTVTLPASATTIRATYSYTLEVINGSGSGFYGVGDVVPISADPPDTGTIFVKWTGDSQYVADLFAANTTLAMPEASISVTATYGDPALYRHLTVVNGSGSGTFLIGAHVPIDADPPVGGRLFSRWTGDVECVDDPNSWYTSVTIPSEDATVTAVFSAVRVTSPSDPNTSFMSGQKTEVRWSAPTLSPKQILQVELTDGVDTWVLSSKAQAGKGVLKWTVGKWKSKTGQPIYPDGGHYRIRVSTLDDSDSDLGNSDFAIGRVTSLEIQGPDEVDENSAAQLTCIAHCNYGPDMDITNQKVKWASTSKAAKVGKGGLLAVKEVLADTPCTLTASYGKKATAAQGTLDITLRNTGP